MRHHTPPSSLAACLTLEGTVQELHTTWLHSSCNYRQRAHTWINRRSPATSGCCFGFSTSVLSTTRARSRAQWNTSAGRATACKLPPQVPALGIFQWGFMYCTLKKLEYFHVFPQITFLRARYVKEPIFRVAYAWAVPVFDSCSLMEEGESSSRSLCC